MAVTFPPSGKDARQRRRATFGFVAGFAVLFVLGAAGWWSSMMAIPSFEWVTETQSGITKAEGVLRLLAEAESAERTYVITGQPKYFELHRSSVAQVVGLLDDLAAQIGAKPAQQALVSGLRVLVAEKTVQMARTMEVRDLEGLEAAGRVVAENAGAAISAQIRQRMSELISLEVVLRSRQETVFLQRSRRATIAIGLALVVTTALMAFAVRWLHRRMRDLENIVTVCAWTKRVKHRGQWISMEQYLRVRYGLLFSHGISDEAKKQLQLEAFEAAGRGETHTGGETTTAEGRGVVS